MLQRAPPTEWGTWGVLTDETVCAALNTKVKAAMRAQMSDDPLSMLMSMVAQNESNPEANMMLGAMLGQMMASESGADASVALQELLTNLERQTAATDEQHNNSSLPTKRAKKC